MNGILFEQDRDLQRNKRGSVPEIAVQKCKMQNTEQKPGLQDSVNKESYISPLFQILRECAVLILESGVFCCINRIIDSVTKTVHVVRHGVHSWTMKVKKICKQRVQCIRSPFYNMA